MKLRPGRLLLFLFFLGFAVFFGLDLARSGLERVQGPLEQAGRPVLAAAPVVNTNGKAAAVAPVKSTATNTVKAETAAKEDSKAEEPKIEKKESFLNHLTNRIGDALRLAARGLMDLIVSAFRAIIT